MPDFSARGADGNLPNGFVEFQRGVIYTVHPRMFAALEPGEEYRVLATTRRKRPDGEPLDSYEPFYRRVRSLLDRRVNELQRQTSAPLHTWIAAHGWFDLKIPGGVMGGAAVALGIRVANGDAPRSQDEPSAELLRTPFVEQLAEADQRDSWRWDEFYNEFDMQPADRSICNLSYGEYISTYDGLDFEPIVRRAEQRARFIADRSLSIVRRTWQCLETGKASRPLMAHVDIYFTASV